MSKLAVAAGCALTMAGFGILAISQFNLHFNETPAEQKARVAKEATQAWLVLGGIATVGAMVALKTSHSDLGKGMILGSGAVLGLGLLATVTPTLPPSPKT